MKADAIKAVLAKAGSDQEPTDADLVAAGGEALDLVLGFLIDVRRIADALTTLAGAVDDNCQPAIVVKALIEPAPSDPNEV